MTERDERTELGGGFALRRLANGFWDIINPEEDAIAEDISDADARAFAATIRPPASADVVKLVDDLVRREWSGGDISVRPMKDIIAAEKQAWAARAALLDAFAALTEQFNSALTVRNKHVQQSLDLIAELAAKDAEIERLTKERDAWAVAKRKLQQDQYERPWTINDVATERRRAEEAEADLARLKAARVPEGWVLMPAEISDEMKNIWWNVTGPVEWRWKKMIEASGLLASEAASAQARPGDVQARIEATIHHCLSRRCSSSGRGRPGSHWRKERCNDCPLDAVDESIAALNQTGEA